MAETTKKVKKEPKARIYIAIDPLNPNIKEEYFQLDGKTVAVAKGKFAIVPLWIAERAKEIHLIEDFETVED